MGEIWKASYVDGYSVSNLGRVRNDTNGHIHRPSVRSTTAPYYRVSLKGDDGKWHDYNVHRLVAFAFLGDPPPNCVVNHIDANKLNNNANNLEWVTQSENLRHSYRLGRRHMPKENIYKAINATKRRVVNLTLGKEYESATEAARAIGGNANGVSRCALGHRRTYRGMKFAYAD